MSKQRTTTLELVQMALFSAIIVTLAFTPLGFVPLLVIYATTVHIPVIIGSVLLGPKKGAVLGLVFGTSSMIKATISPHLTSFAFSPFYTGGEFLGGSWQSIIVSLVPRILVGVLPYYVYHLAKKCTKKETLPLLLAGVCGSLTNTILVMHLIYLFFGDQYGTVMGFDPNAIYGAILLIIATSGLAEAFVSGTVVPSVTHVLLKTRLLQRRPSL